MCPNSSSPAATTAEPASLQDANDAFIEITVDDVIRDWNLHAAALFGWPAREAIGCKLAWLMLSPAQRPVWQSVLQQCLSSRIRPPVKKRIELVALGKDGSEIPIEITLMLVRLASQTHFTLWVRNLSRQCHAERELRERTALLALCREAIVVTDMDDRILFWNAGAEQMYGFLAEEALGRQRHELLPEVRQPSSTGACDLFRTLLTKDSWDGELVQIRRDGSTLTVLCRMLVERDRHGEPARLLMSSTDVSALKQVIEISARQAESEQRFHSLFQHHTDGVFAFNSLSRITAANPALCNLTGCSPEELLAMPLAALVAPPYLDDVRSRVLDALRGKPQACDLQCVRKNGERFDANIILLPDIVGGQVVGMYGIVKDISHRKQNERRIEYLANHDALTGLSNRNLLEERIRHAIEQAKRLGTRIGVLFMDLNRFKIINDSLGHEVGDLLLCAIGQIRTWQGDSMPPLKVAVNLSAVQLASEKIGDVIRRALVETTLDARFLELEITESSLLQDFDTCTRTLNDIRQLGVTLSIDDFGTGYSSLGYLKRLPIDILKIDKSFVGDISYDSDAAAIVSATIAMAHRMNLRVVAEGVTSHDQMHFLESCRCDEMQGYLLCQPLPADEMEMFFKTADLRGLNSSTLTDSNVLS